MVRQRCPHCNKQVKHKKQCKKFDADVEKRYQAQLKRETAEREAYARRVAEEKRLFDEEVARFREQYPRIWQFIESKIQEYNVENRQHYDSSY